MAPQIAQYPIGFQRFLQVHRNQPAMHGFEFGFSPSIVLGGGLSHGSTVSGQIYRFSLTARHQLSGNAYTRLEAGFAHCEARGGNFGDVDDFVGGVALGFRLNNAPFSSSKS